MTSPIRVYINATPVDVPPGATALDAVRLWDQAEAEELAAGRRILTDSRGLPTDPELTPPAGSIFRVIPARTRGDGGIGDVHGTPV